MWSAQACLREAVRYVECAGLPAPGATSRKGGRGGGNNGNAAAGRVVVAAAVGIDAEANSEQTSVAFYRTPRFCYTKENPRIYTYAWRSNRSARFNEANFI